MQYTERLGWWGGFIPQLSYLPFLFESYSTSTVAASTDFTYLCESLIVQPLALVFGSALCLVFGFLSLLPSSLSFSLPFSMASTPPTSPHCSQAAGHHAEHASHTLGSPEQHRTPAGPSAPSAAAATPSLPSRKPVTFQGQTYYNLPTDLACLPSWPSTSSYCSTTSQTFFCSFFSCSCPYKFTFIY